MVNERKSESALTPIDKATTLSGPEERTPNRVFGSGMGNVGAQSTMEVSPMVSLRKRGRKHKRGKRGRKM